MDRAGERMQADEPAEETQDEALDRLDDAAAELEQAERDLEERLLREQRAKLRNLVSNLRDRQQAAVKELERLIGRAAEPAGWTRSVKSELSGLASTQSTLSEDTVQLADDKFEPLPVFRQLSRRSAEAMDHAVDLLRQQIRPAATAPPQDGTALALEWQRLALRRMTQLLDALEEPKDESSRQRASDGQRPPRDGDADSSTAGSRDGVPAKAQLQALRALQAELIERTATFAKTHPEGAKSTPADQLELQILREAQADVAVLVEQLTALSGEQP
jgi:hypothetical protein